MAEKIKINDHGDVIFTEQDAIESTVHQIPNFDISKLFFDRTEPSTLQRALKELGIDLPVINTAPKRDQHLGSIR